MLNKEKFAEEIIEIACVWSRVAVVNGKPRRCSGLACNDCDFGNCCGDCADRTIAWANSEYVEPPVDWSKVPVDTPIFVRDSESDKWCRRYFARYTGGKVYAWECGATSWSAEDSDNACEWKYAKLAESEESHD